MTTAAVGRSAVLCGIDVLERDNFRLLAGQRIGLITNHTGVNREGDDGKPAGRCAGGRTKALFSPEHGIQGKLDVPRSATARSETGSRSGVCTARPQADPESLEGIDTLVFDIQDIGTRFYTYISTLAVCDAGGGREHTRIRRARSAESDQRNRCRRSGAGPGPRVVCRLSRMPVRHGMTVGELATMFRDELRLSLDLSHQARRLATRRFL